MIWCNRGQGLLVLALYNFDLVCYDRKSMVRKRMQSLLFLKIFFLLIFSLFSYLLIKGFLEVRNLPKVDNIGNFVEHFDTSSLKSVEVGRRCNFFVINCENNDYYSSTLFPYMALQITLINYERCGQDNHDTKNFISASGSKYLLLDPFWKIFWLSIVECSRGDQYFFGPYRI